MAKPDGKGGGNKEKLLPVGATEVVQRAPQKAKVIEREKLKASIEASLDAKSLQGTILAQAFPAGGGNVASDAPSFDYESFVAAPKIRRITNVRKEFPYVEGVKLRGLQAAELYKFDIIFPTLNL